MKKHGVEKRRTCHKLHSAADIDSHEAISAEVSRVNIGDSEALPTLLNPLRKKITAVSADGAYDTKNGFIADKRELKTKTVVSDRVLTPNKTYTN